MKKHLLSIFVALLSLLASAQDKVEIDGIWYNLITEGNVAEVTFKGDSHDEYNEYSGHITIPATVNYEGAEYAVTSIGDMALTYCSNVTSITIPESVTSIGQHAFFSCSGLTDISLPEGVTSIRMGTFGYCSGLTSITIPESVTSIGMDAFMYCSSLTSIIIPESVTDIGSYAFYECNRLADITLSKGLKTIAHGAFSGCSSLTSITLPENLTLIGGSAFSNCSSLTAVTIPKSIMSITESAFSGCSSLSDVYCYAEKVPSTNANAFDDSYPEYATLHVPSSALGDYKRAKPWSSFGSIVALTDKEMNIEQLKNDNSQLTIYDLSGRRVEKAEKGIYIVDGRKVVIK